MWTRCEREGRDGVLAAIEELVSAGVEVPSVLAIQDLRGLARLGDIPASRELGKRWGWGEKRARLLLANEARWVDPSGGVEGRKQGARRAHGGRTEATSDEPVEHVVEGEGRIEGASRAHEGRKKGDARVPSPTRPDQDQTENYTAPAPPSLVLVPPQAPTEDTAPSWAAKVPHKGTTSGEYATHVCRALAAIRGRDVDPARCATDAREVVGLWSALDRPPIGALADELVLVAKWAQGSREAENDLRGVRPDGSTWGPDRSRNVSTLCVRKAWGDRLEAARRWQEHGDRPVSEPQRRTGGPAPPSAGDGVLDRLWAAEQAKRAEEFEA